MQTSRLILTRCPALRPPLVTRLLRQHIRPDQIGMPSRKVKWIAFSTSGGDHAERPEEQETPTGLVALPPQGSHNGTKYHNRPERRRYKLQQQQLGSKKLLPDRAEVLDKKEDRTKHLNRKQRRQLQRLQREQLAVDRDTHGHGGAIAGLEGGSTVSHGTVEAHEASDEMDWGRQQILNNLASKRDRSRDNDLAVPVTSGSLEESIQQPKVLGAFARSFRLGRQLAQQRPALPGDLAAPPADVAELAPTSGSPNAGENEEVEVGTPAQRQLQYESVQKPSNPVLQTPLADAPSYSVTTRIDGQERLEPPYTLGKEDTLPQEAKEAKRVSELMDLRSSIVTSSGPSAFDALPAARPPKRDANARKRATSLLSELFPEATKKKSSKSSKRPERVVGKIPIDADIVQLAEAVSVQEARAASSQEETVRRKTRRDSIHRWRTAMVDLGVLVLRKASMNLDESDFKRIIPGGTHLGWVKANILKVIQARDTTTLEARPDYFIIFANDKTARAYHEHAHALHDYARLFQPGVSSAPPLPRSSRYAASIAAVPMGSYTLGLPSHRLDLSFANQPFSPNMQRMIENEGYDNIYGGKNTKHEVLLSTDVKGLSSMSVKRALFADGQDRGVAWSLASGRHVREYKHSQVSPPRPQSSNTSTPDGVDDDDQVNKRVPPPTFVISLTSAEEARRLAAAWHKRNITSLLDSGTVDEEEVIMNAELLM